MGIKANDIATQIKDNLYEHNTSEQIREAKKNAFGEQKETSEIAELLVPYVAARRMQQLAQSGIPTAPAISDRYVAHKMLSTKHQFEVLRIPVVLDGINPPTDSDLEDLISNRSEWHVDDTGDETSLGLNSLSGFQLSNETYGPFGVRSPRKFGYQYVTFNDAAYDRYARVKFEESITEENLKTYYETNIERYPAPDDTFDAIEDAANGEEHRKMSGTNPTRMTMALPRRIQTKQLAMLKKTKMMTLQKHKTNRLKSQPRQQKKTTA